MIKIENNKLVVLINELGAELTSIIRKNDDYEYIWNDTSGKYWHRHSPILFPATGRSINDSYLLNEKNYPMMQHGFARDNEWTVSELIDNQVTLSLKENETTLKNYPFKFTIAVTYKLNDNYLSVNTTITNNDNKKMPFALGFHPAFNATFDDLSISLEPVNGEIKIFSLATPPFISGEAKTLKAANGNQIAITHELLDKSFLLIKNPEIKKAIMKSNGDTHSVTIDLGNFPYLNIWSQEHVGAPFICIEPFAGLPDIESDQPTDWYQKKGNTILTPNEDKEFNFQIEFS